MTYQLKIDEMLEALCDINHPRYEQHKQAVETVASAIALELAAALGVKCGDATFEGLGFAGTCAPFWPVTPEQPCPEVIASYDAPSDENWEHPDDPDLLPTSPI